MQKTFGLMLAIGVNGNRNYFEIQNELFCVLFIMNVMLFMMNKRTYLRKCRTSFRVSVPIKVTFMGTKTKSQGKVHEKGWLPNLWELDGLIHAS